MMSKMEAQSCACCYSLLSFGHSSSVFALLHSGVLVLGFSEADWDVLVLVHVHDLSLHGHEEEHEEVHEEDGPEDRHIEDREEGHDYTRANALGACQPELELRQPSRERSEFLAFIRCRWQTWPGILRVLQRRQEGDEVVQQKNPQPVRDDEVSLDEVHSQEEQCQQHHEGDPTWHNMNRRLVQPVLYDSLDLRMLLLQRCPSSCG
mmetsp:Transcript_4990/g.13239  ORF Transcript_4990/g.13239 Transcript_4990/m.13239 type:complete len:206 (+) Transcript_4990:173-790(+)